MFALYHKIAHKTTRKNYDKKHHLKKVKIFACVGFAKFATIFNVRITKNYA